MYMCTTRVSHNVSTTACSASMNNYICCKQLKLYAGLYEVHVTTVLSKPPCKHILVNKHYTLTNQIVLMFLGG